MKEWDTGFAQFFAQMDKFGFNANLYLNTDLSYGLEFDSAPGFWLKGHPAVGSLAVRKLEGALAAVNFFDPYTGTNQKLFRFLVDDQG